jgi:hypothetical protein
MTSTTLITKCGRIRTKGKQFLDFIKRRADRRNDDNIIQIFSVLDNASIYINQTK